MVFRFKSGNWDSIQKIENKAFICGYCNHKVSSDTGYKIGQKNERKVIQIGGAYICSNCKGLTFFTPNEGKQLPSPAMGNPVEHLPKDLNELYEEARKCTSQNCYTAAVMLCRKILMNTSVDKGAKGNLSFAEYVDHLDKSNIIPKDGKDWVDHIRKKGNEANHEIKPISEEDAEDLLTFTEMLLKVTYEFPMILKNKQKPVAPKP